MISIYKRVITLLLILSISIGVISAQGYVFTDVVRNAATPVKNQANSGTCWSYATAAFLESELLRIGKGEFNLSEMFVVRHNYINRLNDNFLRRGKGNLGQGSLAHMFINIVDKHGIVPFDVYNGINYDSNLNNHRELNKYLNSIAEASVSLKAQSPEYHKLIESLLDIYLGPIPNEFTYKGKKYTPKTFLTHLGLKMDDYVQFKTHDVYFNAAMKQMVYTGYMHNYMRMYWAKKIIEWSTSYKEAYQTILYLNNTYFIDGHDPNGYTGIAWCFGKHDRPWGERPIFGKLRYMNMEGLKRKFDMTSYVLKINDLEKSKLR